MTFRNELDALRAHNETLERELSRVAEEKAALEERAARAAALAEELEEAKRVVADLEHQLGRGPAGERARAREKKRRVTLVALALLLAGAGAFIGAREVQHDDETAAMREEHLMERERNEVELLRLREQREEARMRAAQLEMELRELRVDRPTPDHEPFVIPPSPPADLVEILRERGIELPSGTAAQLRGIEMNGRSLDEVIEAGGP